MLCDLTIEDQQEEAHQRRRGEKQDNHDQAGLVIDRRNFKESRNKQQTEQHRSGHGRKDDQPQLGKGLGHVVQRDQTDRGQ